MCHHSDQQGRRRVYQLPSLGVQHSGWDPAASPQKQSILVVDKRRSQLFIKSIKQDMFVPSSSACSNTIDKYNPPSHFGFRRDESRLNQCPCPGSRSSTPLGMAPNRLSANQCWFRLRMNPSWVLRGILVRQAFAVTGRETYWGWLVYALISWLRQLTSLIS